MSLPSAMHPLATPPAMTLSRSYPAGYRRPTVPAPANQRRWGWDRDGMAATETGVQPAGQPSHNDCARTAIWPCNHQHASCAKLVDAIRNDLRVDWDGPGSCDDLGTRLSSRGRATVQSSRLVAWWGRAGLGMGCKRDAPCPMPAPLLFACFVKGVRLLTWEQRYMQSSTASLM